LLGNLLCHIIRLKYISPPVLYSNWPRQLQHYLLLIFPKLSVLTFETLLLFINNSVRRADGQANVHSLINLSVLLLQS
jgi:hypothetical protein